VGKTWILTGSLENFRATRDHGFRVIGAKERRRPAQPKRGVAQRTGPAGAQQVTTRYLPGHRGGLPALADVY